MLVLAGAGSGKTSVITRKIAYLVNDCKLPAASVAAVTFTNKAAREMRERVAALVSANAAEQLTISTFHQLGLKIIRTERKTLGLKNGFSIFDGEDTRTLIRDLLIQEHGVQLRALPDDVLQALWRGSQQVMGELVATDSMAAKVYKSYSEFYKGVRNYHHISEQSYINMRDTVMGEEDF